MHSKQFAIKLPDWLPVCKSALACLSCLSQSGSRSTSAGLAWPEFAQLHNRPIFALFFARADWQRSVMLVRRS